MLRRVLDLPGGFDLYQWLVGAPESKRRFVHEQVRPQPGQTVLDLGCGTGALLRWMPAEIEYIGVDTDEHYLEAARKRYGSRGEFVCADVTRYRPERTFDLAVAYGLLHHLDDAQVEAALVTASAARRFVSAEPALEPTTRALEAFLMRHDRGRFVRSRDAYVRLAEGVFASVDSRLVERTYRIPFTLAVLDCSA